MQKNTPLHTKGAATTRTLPKPVRSETQEAFFDGANELPDDSLEFEDDAGAARRAPEETEPDGGNTGEFEDMMIDTEGVRFATRTDGKWFSLIESLKKMPVGKGLMLPPEYKDSRQSIRKAIARLVPRQFIVKNVADGRTFIKRRITE